MELEPAVELIVSQQAKFAAGLDAIRQKHAADERMGVLIGVVDGLVRGQLKQ
jgi:hypothetical protein